MNTFLMLIVGLGFGSLAWAMLWAWDRLLADKAEHRPAGVQIQPRWHQVLVQRVSKPGAIAPRLIQSAGTR
jgi:hypothetical protein